MREFYTEIIINAKPAVVWDKFISPTGFFPAFYNARIRSDFTIGSKLEYVEEKDSEEIIHIYGKVLEYEKGKVLAYSDHPGPAFAKNPGELEARVRLTLDPIGSATKLTLTNDQFSEGNPMAEQAQQWYLILSNLKTFIETGELMKIN